MNRRPTFGRQCNSAQLCPRRGSCRGRFGKAPRSRCRTRQSLRGKKGCRWKCHWGPKKPSPLPPPRARVLQTRIAGYGCSGKGGKVRGARAHGGCALVACNGERRLRGVVAGEGSRVCASCSAASGRGDISVLHNLHRRGALRVRGSVNPHLHTAASHTHEPPARISVRSTAR